MSPGQFTHFIPFSNRISSFVQQSLSRLKISENTFLIVLAVIIGVLGGFGNFLFRKTIELIHWLVVEQSLELFDISLEHWSMQRVLVMFLPAIGGVMVIPLWVLFSKDLKGGFAGFLVKVNLKGAKLPLRPLFTKGLASAITLGTGGSAGRKDRSL